jgi:hypothetical protein
LSISDEEHVDGFLEFGFFQDGDEKRRKAGYAFGFDVLEEMQRLGLLRLCDPYDRNDALFHGSPKLWESLRPKEVAQLDDQLIDFKDLVQENQSEIIRIPGGYGRLPSAIRPGLIVWLRSRFPDCPLFVRLDP